MFARCYAFMASCQRFVSSDPMRGLTSHRATRFCNPREQG